MLLEYSRTSGVDWAPTSKNYLLHHTSSSIAFCTYTKLYGLMKTAKSNCYQPDYLELSEKNVFCV